MKWLMSEYAGYKSLTVSLHPLLRLKWKLNGIFSGALLRDPLKSNPRANFDENDNRVGAPDCSAEDWDLSHPPIENGRR